MTVNFQQYIDNKNYHVSNKDHGWDNISIRMIKLCDEVIKLPVLIIFKSILN